jgi:hypothetical protein
MHLGIAGFTKTLLFSFGVTLLLGSEAFCQTVQVGPDVFSAFKHDVSPPLREIKPARPVSGPPRVIQHGTHLPEIIPAQPDSVVQRMTLPTTSAVLGPYVDGLNDASQATVSGILFAPPDTNAAVGGNQIVQWVNYAFAVFDIDRSTGTVAPHGPPYPLPGNSLWTGFGGQCELNNSGDPIAQFDKLANRWVMMQPVFTKPFAICVAVSTGPDFGNSFNRYEFRTPKNYFPDYPKLGMWPDAYYLSIDLFSPSVGVGGAFQGAYLCALDRFAIIRGDTATMQCFPKSTGSLDPTFMSLLPSDFDGAAPPAGSPDYFVNLGRNSLNIWKFHVDFSNPASSSLTFLPAIPVAPFSEACGGGVCIPQSGTTQLLDSLGDRLMYRLAYRNFGNYESLVVNHSVTAGMSVGIRWYELRKTSRTEFSVFQQGTFAPDNRYRWMGSIAMDKLGDIALGYSVSSISMHPSISYTGRVPADPPGQMESERSPTAIVNGGGSQLKVSNWGDYSSMRVDPFDDCTFWYTTEYLPSDGKFNWSTRIASIKFPNCH